MARTRNIKPGFFKNEELCELSPYARLLFAGLWTLADREGRIEERPKKIKAEIFPYENCDIPDLLSALEAAKFVSRYTVGDLKIVQVNNWKKHQHPHPKEPTSELPPPETAAETVREIKSRVITRQVAESHGEVAEKRGDEVADNCAAATSNGKAGADPSLPSFPSSNPSANTLTTEIAAPPLPVYVPASEAPKQPTVREMRAADMRGVTSRRFPEFWSKWPRKVNRDNAAREYLNCVFVEDEPRFFACVDRYLSSDEVARGVFMDGAKWIVMAHSDNWESTWPVAREPTQRSATQIDKRNAAREAMDNIFPEASNGG